MKILPIILLLISCSSSTPMSDNLNRIGQKAACLVQKKLDLYCDGIGRMVKDGKVVTVDLSFINKNPMTIEEGRILLLNTVKISLDLIREDQPFQEYLLKKPFNINNLTLLISTNSFTRIETPPGLVTCLSLISGLIQYDRFDLQTKRFVTIYEETYEEALQKCEAAL